jgi:RNA polymerase sigma factor (sigma-70 family)
LPENRAVAEDGTAPGASATVGEDPEELLIARHLESGDAGAALPLLMDRHGATVYRYCRRMLGEDADGDDVSQIVFLQAFEAIRKCPRIENVRAWLLGIARHRCLDRLERRKRGPVPVESAELERALDAESNAELLVRDPGTSRALEECLDGLDRRSRAVVLLRFHDQLSYEDIGKLTGDRPGALRVRVARALSALRRCLESKGGMP